MTFHDEIDSPSPPQMAREAHMCQNMAKGISDEVRVMYQTETYPQHPQIIKMKEAVTENNLIHLDELIDKWFSNPDRPAGSEHPGYEMGVLEPVFIHAIEQGRDSIVSYLMARGVHLCDKTLYKAAECNASPAVFQAFLDHGWDINKQMNWARPPPLYLVLNKPELLLWFLDYGADPNMECKKGISPFMVAAAEAPLQVVQLLYQRGARPGNTAPPAAKSQIPGRLEVLEFLLDIGAPIDTIEFEHNALGRAGEFNIGSAINLAVCRAGYNPDSESEKIVELLLSRGARTDIAGYNGRTAIDLATEFGNTRILDLFRKYGVDQSHIVNETKPGSRAGAEAEAQAD